MASTTRIVALLWLCSSGAAQASPAAEGDDPAAVSAEVAQQQHAAVEVDPLGVCGRGFGGAVGGQNTGLRWDFVSEGTITWAGSASLGLWCERRVGQRSLRLFGSVDAVPTYLHLYNQVERRQSLWLQARAGVTKPLGHKHGIGAHLVTNLATIGVGAHGRVGLPWGPDEGEHALDLRTDVFTGEVPGFQLSLLYSLQLRWF